MVFLGFLRLSLSIKSSLNLCDSFVLLFSVFIKIVSIYYNVNSNKSHNNSNNSNNNSINHNYNHNHNENENENENEIENENKTITQKFYGR